MRDMDFILDHLPLSRGHQFEQIFYNLHGVQTESTATVSKSISEVII